MIVAKNIHKSFGKLEVLKGIDLTIEPEKVVSITGSSGAGKTTLLQVLGTLSRPNQGEVWIDHCNLTSLSERKLAHFRNNYIGFVFQFHHLLPEFSSLENVCIPAFINKKTKKVATQEAERLLTLLGIKDRMAHKPNELSGGEKQRVAIARALINQPKIIFADEPSGNLDTQNKNELHQLFFSLRDEMKQSFVIVTHDEEFAQQTDRRIHLTDGEVR